MLVRPSSADARLVALFVGRICYLMAGVSTLPIAWAALGREWGPLASLLLMAGVFTMVGAVATTRPLVDQRLQWSHGMVIVAMAWLIIPVIGAIPFVLSGHFGSPLDAWFESVSGLTTTGLTLLQDIDHFAPSLGFWRILLQFLGGMGIVVVALSVFAGAGGLTLYHGEAREDRLLPSVASSARFIWRVSMVHLVLGVTALVTVGLLFVGFAPGRALFHGLMVFLAAFSTGGFAAQSTSIGYYHSAPFEAVTAMLMIAGSTSFALHLALWQRRRGSGVLGGLETRAWMSSFATTLMVFMIGLASIGAYDSVLGLTRQGLFQIVSAHTTTGFSTVANSELATWGGLAFVAMIVAMAFGGMGQSTAGGIKALRVGLTVKALKDSVKEVLLPDRAVVSHAYEHGGKRQLTPGLAQSAMVVSLLFVASFALGAAVAFSYGIPLDSAIFESVSASSTIGLSVGVTDPLMPVTLKATYVIQMWMGRLEFVAVFALMGFVIAWVKGR